MRRTVSAMVRAVDMGEILRENARFELGHPSSGRVGFRPIRRSSNLPKLASRNSLAARTKRDRRTCGGLLWIDTGRRPLPLHIRQGTRAYLVSFSRKRQWTSSKFAFAGLGRLLRVGEHAIQGLVCQLSIGCA